MTLKQFVAKLGKGGYKVDIIPVENYTGIFILVFKVIVILVR